MQQKPHISTPRHPLSNIPHLRPPLWCLQHNNSGVEPINPKHNHTHHPTPGPSNIDARNVETTAMDTEDVAVDPTARIPTSPPLNRWEGATTMAPKHDMDSANLQPDTTTDTNPHNKEAEVTASHFPTQLNST
jgi:hypothetical protein